MSHNQCPQAMGACLLKCHTEIVTSQWVVDKLTHVHIVLVALQSFGSGVKFTSAILLDNNLYVTARETIRYKSVIHARLISATILIGDTLSGTTKVHANFDTYQE